MREPLRVFELDFEANLPIVRACVRYKKRIVFPSTSEVYGMCARREFDSETSELVLGPINKPRWIYACAKQLMDRVIHAYGMQEGLDYTLFRPFNWIGSGLDSINTAEGRQLARDHAVPRPHRARRADQAGRRRHAEARVHLHRRRHRRADEASSTTRTASPRGKIYNIGNPRNNFSVRELAQMMLELALTYPEYRDTARAGASWSRRPRTTTTATGYQDVQNRVPKIANTCADLDWKPTVTMDEALKRIFDAYRGQVAEARRLVE